MCGIIYTEGKDCKTNALTQYKRQISRGQAGYGFVAINKDLSINYKRSTDYKTIEKLLENTSPEYLLFHHRIPTSTRNIKEANHPIRIEHEELQYNYYFIHNGIISNDKELKAKHDTLGYKYTTEIIDKVITSGDRYVSTSYNDSESLGIEVVRYIEGKAPQIEAEGSIAFMVLQVAKDTNKALKLYYAHNEGNPLKVDTEEGRISSETGDDIETYALYCQDYVTGETTIRRGLTLLDRQYQSACGFGYADDSDEYDEKHESGILIGDNIYTDEELLDIKKNIRQEMQNAQIMKNHTLYKELKDELEDIEDYMRSSEDNQKQLSLL